MESSQQCQQSSLMEDTTEMTSSYHEISDDREKHTNASDLEKSLPEEAKRLFDKARNWVGDLSLEGGSTQEGLPGTHIAQDFEDRVLREDKRTGDERPQTKTTSSQLGGHIPESICVADLNVVVNEMELEAKKLAQSVDTLTENLTGILHSLSSMTVDCVFTASDGVTQLCDTADASIKVMYQVMAKCEELNKAVQPLYQVHSQIKETKRLLDKVESEMN